MTRTRCPWGLSDPLYLTYHDNEWGVPQHDDRRLFEMLILEGAQAGLSWLTVLKKRPYYQQAFDKFDPQRVARYNARKTDQLLTNDKIIRNRLKISSAVSNARAFLVVQQEFGTFDEYIWAFVAGEPRQHTGTLQEHVPANTSQSDASGRRPSDDAELRIANARDLRSRYSFQQMVEQNQYHKYQIGVQPGIIHIYLLQEPHH